MTFIQLSNLGRFLKPAAKTLYTSIYREDIKLQDSPYPIQIPARGLHPKIGKILLLFIEHSFRPCVCSMKSQSIFPILGWKPLAGNLNWIGRVLKLYHLTVLIELDFF